MREQKSIACTLIMPRVLRDRVRAAGSIASVLRHALMAGNRMAAGRRIGGPLRVRYQASRPDLVRVDFRVESLLWYEFGCYAKTLGISRCRAFVELVEAVEEWFASQGRSGGSKRKPREGRAPRLGDTEIVGTPIDPRLKREFLLTFELVRIQGGIPTVVRRRKYVDSPGVAWFKRLIRPLIPRQRWGLG